MPHQEPPGTLSRIVPCRSGSPRPQWWYSRALCAAGSEPVAEAASVCRVTCTPCYLSLAGAVRRQGYKHCRGSHSLVEASHIVVVATQVRLEARETAACSLAFGQGTSVFWTDIVLEAHVAAQRFFPTVYNNSNSTDSRDKH